MTTWPSLFRRLLWAATLATGFGLVWAVSSTWLGSVTYNAWLSPQRDRPPQEDFVVMSDGTPAIRSTPRSGPFHSTYRHLNGMARDLPQSGSLIGPVYLSGAA